MSRKVVCSVVIPYVIFSVYLLHHIPVGILSAQLSAVALQPFASLDSVVKGHLLLNDETLGMLEE